MASKHSSERIACFLEGGYNLDVMGMCSVILLEELMEVSISDYKEEYKENENTIQYTESLIEHVIEDSPLL
jgi:acetoin utilization deacetylase AcuC-like enzyme